ncbi:MAG: imidazole glycerol phosphate synthase subunit HisH [Methylococcaceae bacterium]
MKSKISILDYGLCNIYNVIRAFEYCGAEVEVIHDSTKICKASKLVIPGVGSFKGCITEIRSQGMDYEIIRYVNMNRPFLGICVGMQMLFDYSQEFGTNSGLGIINGCVIEIPRLTIDGKVQRIPHIGWNELIQTETKSNWNNTVFSGLENSQPSVYFVHSFVCHPSNHSVRLADFLYGGIRMCAAIQHNNIIATQFHPERSGHIGLDILNRFILI